MQKEITNWQNICLLFVSENSINFAERNVVQMQSYNQAQLSRLGNTVVYLATKIPSLNKTQLLKLLFLIEQFSVITYNRPFLNLQFEVWKFGPVNKDVFIDLSPGESALLKDYINVTCDCENKSKIMPISKFCDDEFSDNDIALLDSVIKTFGKKTAKNLVDITHDKKGIWYKLAKENDLLLDFDRGIRNSSDVKIDLSSLLDGCAKDFYIEQCETQQFFNNLNY